MLSVRSWMNYKSQQEISLWKLETFLTTETWTISNSRPRCGDGLRLT